MPARPIYRITPPELVGRGPGLGQHMSKSDGLRSSDYCRERAEEARARAEGMHDDAAKETMLQIARTYDAMAKQAAAKEATQR
jgi:hypothetical protein